MVPDLRIFFRSEEGGESDLLHNKPPGQDFRNHLTGRRMHESILSHIFFETIAKVCDTLGSMFRLFA